MEETTAEIQVLRTTALTPVNDLGLGRDAVDGNGDHLETVRASVPGWCVERDDKVTVSILFTTCTHPYGVERELTRRTLLERLERVVPGRPPSNRMWGGRGEGRSNRPGGKNQED